ncbi:MAG: chemotaxis protein CheW [Nitrospirota bacterium]
MDIAKIRKKAQSRQSESRKEEKPADRPVEKEKEEKGKETDNRIPEPVIQEESVVGKPDSGDKEPDFSDNIVKETGEDDEDIVELLTFSLLKEEFAFRVAEVEEIIKYQRITNVPTMPDYVLGITSLRGKIIPVIDLITRLGLRSKSQGRSINPDLTVGSGNEKDEDKKILIVSGPEGFIGATIDRVIGVVRSPQNKILDPPAHLTEAELKFIEGVIISEKRFISIIRSQDAVKIEFK